VGGLNLFTERWKGVGLRIGEGGPWREGGQGYNGDGASREARHLWGGTGSSSTKKGAYKIRGEVALFGATCRLTKGRLAPGKEHLGGRTWGVTSVTGDQETVNTSKKGEGRREE